MNGWLSPGGEFYPCPIGKHQVKAYELVGNADTWVAVHPSGCFSELPLTGHQITWIKASGNSKYLQDLELMLDIQNDIQEHG